MSAIENLQATIAAGTPVVMDGGFGQQLTERGGNTTMPLWATHELLEGGNGKVVGAIHTDYITAGATIIETGTFRAQAATFESHQTQAAAGEDDLKPIESWGTRDPAELSRRAILIAGELAVKARQESGKSGIIIAGSAGPIRDSYTPSATPSDRELAKAHEHYIAALAESGVDFVSIETIPTIREAVAAARAAESAGIPYSVNFWGAKSGKIGHDEALGDGVRALERAGLTPLSVGVNCVAMEDAGASIKELRNHTDLPIAVSANGNGDPTQVGTWEYHHLHDRRYADAAMRWIDAGALLVGGCCGTTPATIKEVSQATRQTA